MASYTMYDRKVKLTVAPPVAGTFTRVNQQMAMVIADLRVKFKVTKTLRKEPNNSEIEVYNLSPNSRGVLKDKGVRVWLEAGYGTALGQLFVGDCRFCQHYRDKGNGTDIITKFELGDGERAFAHGRVNASFKGGTTKADILKKLAQQSGWDLGNIADFYASLGQKQLQGHVAWGKANKAIDDLLRSAGLTYSVQDGKIQILPLTGYMPQPAILLDSDHGLIGSPEFGTAEKKGKARTLKVKSLLQADLKPGGRINLQAEVQKGVFVIQKVEHVGDNYGGDWFSNCEVVPV